LTTKALRKWAIHIHKLSPERAMDMKKEDLLVFLDDKIDKRHKKWRTGELGNKHHDSSAEHTEKQHKNTRRLK
jgi:hypothetical protein